MFDALARLVSGRPKRVVAIAAVTAVLAGAFGGNVASVLGPFGSADPDTGSAKAEERLRDATGVDPAVGLVALVETGAPARSATARAKVARVAAALERDEAVARVTTFYMAGNRDLVSEDGRSQYAAVNFRAISDGDQQDAAERLGEDLNGNGVKLGGWAAASADVNTQVEEDLRKAEMLAFPVLFLLSLLFFRSLVAAALPLLVGGLAIVGTFAALKAANEVTEISIFALNLTTGIGLGLAIDYSLFMVARYREEVAIHGAGAEALRRTLATPGAPFCSAR